MAVYLLSLNREKLEFAMVYAADPDVLLQDEPFEGLGDQEIDEILVVLRKSVHKKTVIIIEHKISKLTTVVDKLAVMHEGRIIASGLAGLGGVLNAPLIMVKPYRGWDMLLFTFITVILGGLGSIKGTMVAALILGQVMSIGGAIWSPLAFVAPFAVMFLVILIKPTGLFGIESKAFGFD